MKLNIDLENQIVDKINQLYITERKKYLSMYRKQGEVKYSTTPYTLSDNVVRRHLRRKATIGVFAGQYLTSFVCFDVDTKSLVRARSITYRLVNVLMEDFHIHEKHIHVSFSGSKGYHVEIFFTKPIGNRSIRQFYQKVLRQLGELGDSSKIELRPTATQGVKIPLSKHWKTDRICSYVDTITLEPIRKKSHILTIEQIDSEDFINLVFNELEQADVFYLSPAEADELEEIASQVNTENKPLSEVRNDVELVLARNRLIRDGTRNNMTFLIAVYLHNEGWSIDYVKSRIADLMDNTWNNARHLIDSSTSYEYMMAEVNRITNTVFKYQYILGMTKARIRISKGEVLEILGIDSDRIKKTMLLKKLLFSMLVHSKKFARKDGCFYMAYSVMTRYGNTDNRSRLAEYVAELQRLGLVEVIQKNQLNKALSKELGQAYSEANVYKVTIPESVETATIELRTDENIDLFEVTAQLVPEKEIKKILSRSVYNKQFKEYYNKKTIV